MSQIISPISDHDSAEPPQTEELLVHHNGSLPDKIPLKGQVVTIGRDIRNDLVLNTEAVSRLHARLESEQGVWYITDLGSTNGTYLNKEKLSPYAPQAIGFDDRLKMGDYEIVLNVSGVEAPQPQAANTLLVEPEAEEEADVVDEISLARQLFGGLEDYRPTGVTEQVEAVKPGQRQPPTAFQSGRALFCRAGR